MHIPVGELQQRVSSREFAEWMAYDKEFGLLNQKRLEAYLVQLTTVMANAFGGSYSTDDFVLKFDSHLPDKDELNTKMLAMLANMGKR